MNISSGSQFSYALAADSAGQKPKSTLKEIAERKIELQNKHNELEEKSIETSEKHFGISKSELDKYYEISKAESDKYYESAMLEQTEGHNRSKEDVNRDPFTRLQEELEIINSQMEDIDRPTPKFNIDG